MEKKLRHSHQREMIYNYLLGTVYRNLKLLEETGKVRRVSASQNVERYDAKCFDHAHFVCRKCGSVKDLTELNSKAVGESCHVDEGDSIEWMDIIFGGICSECKAAEK